MEFQERSFIGNNSAVPTPEIYFNADEKLLIVATPWGNSSGAKRLVQTISEYYLATKEDKEATSPFRRLDYLSGIANNLRIAVLVGNELLYREDNRNEYRSGAELFVASMQERELAWVQIGQPHVMISRNQRAILPLSTHLSLASEVDSESLPPLPNSLLGVSSEPDLVIQSISPAKGDGLLLLSRSWIPNELYNVTKRNFQSLSKALSSDAEEPFWLGYLTL